LKRRIRGLVLTTEYLLLIALFLALFASLAVIIYERSISKAESPKLHVRIDELYVIRQANGIYLKMIIYSQSNALFCINYIDVVDANTGDKIVFGDHDIGEVITLPICIKSGEEFMLSGFQAINGTIIPPGDPVYVRIHYSFNQPNLNYNADDPQTIVVFTKALAS